MNPKDRIENIAIYAKDKNNLALDEYPQEARELNYRWLHTLRVAQYGKRLAKLEGANIEIVLAGCLLHDITKLSNVSKDFNHGRAGAKMIRPFLKKLEYSQEDVENICYSVASHVDGFADFEHPRTLEAEVLNDADKLDRFSSYRTVLSLSEFANKEYEEFISAVENRVKYLERTEKEALTQTQSGKKAFGKQIAVQMAYLERLLADYEITALPNL
ncbi:MAG: HD domain-containing protein [Anaerolineae bacterium]|jgi:putative nucleotidyltransferase with HDIG domain|nr:HD domain-containing protein [Anaerolineae bacterium]MBT7074935.1 HD domain-containing protein [Anaerolineae bacterium]MBT7781393.1 HD domain-containing protein [Anaerolineae bacterium]